MVILGSQVNSVFNNCDTAAMAQFVISDKWIAFLIFAKIFIFAIITIKTGPTVYSNSYCNQF